MFQVNSILNVHNKPNDKQTNPQSEWDQDNNTVFARTHAKSKTLEHPSSDSDQASGLREKWGNFVRALLRAGQREDRLPWYQQLKGRLLDFHIGLFQGLGQGVYKGTGGLINSKSDFHKRSAIEVYELIPQAGEDLLDFGTEFMDASWQERGKMQGKATIKTGLFILSLRKAWTSLKGLARKTIK